MYDPLPLTSDDHPSTALYNAPPNPNPHSAPFQIASDPRPHFLGPALCEDLPHTRDSLPAGSDYTSSLYALNDPAGHTYRDDSGAVPLSPVGHSRFLDEKNAAYAPTHAKSRRGILVLVVLIALILVIAAVIIPVYFTVIKPKTDAAGSGGSSSTKTAQGATPTQVAIVTGGDGSTVTMDDGTTFTYNNKFGGYWYFDENDPFNNGARAQSWTPALNETFNYGIDKIRG